MHKKKEYTSLIGTVNRVLPFTEDMHGTTTWRPQPTPAPRDYVQPYANTSCVAVDVQGCNEIMMKNLTQRHLL